MTKVPNDIKELDRRIKALKLKQKRDDEKAQGGNFSKISIGLQLVIELASGTVVGAAIGYMLDEVFDTKYIMLLTLTILGGFAGILNAYMYSKNINSKKEEK